MGRFVGYMNQRGKQSGGSGTIIGTEAYTRSSGITTSANNNVNNLRILKSDKLPPKRGYVYISNYLIYPFIE